MKKYTNISDEELMRHVQKGVEWAFNELYQRYSQRILYFLYKMLKQDEAKAQDLLQDVFLKIVEAPEKFDVNQSFKTWIFTVTANHCKNYFRTQKRSIVELGATSSREGIEKKDEGLNTEAFHQKLNEALMDLPYKYREVFILKYKEGLQLKEIALVMECPLGTVKSRLSSATKLLGKRLAQYKKDVLSNY
ncbi:RNA polymerase sigma factor [Aureispira anguillae]|uniref:RNA polymerase sigma factor n=1 Tax=Aureispira anguillae TaxID=2864201 RepID=A0A915YFC8_9BACT|nr:RNA polymerase sigma factor [Aureispira anguillae]BDS12004.1 RNA polymerase sigma factor [Aureispira anguillae]